MLTTSGCVSGCTLSIRHTDSRPTCYRKVTYDLRCSHGFLIRENGSSIYNGDDEESFVRCAGPGYGIVSDPKSALGAFRFGSVHSGVCQFVFCDGRVKAMNNSVNTTMLQRYALRDDGQIIDDY